MVDIVILGTGFHLKNKPVILSIFLRVKWRIAWFIICLISLACYLDVRGQCVLKNAQDILSRISDKELIYYSKLQICMYIKGLKQETKYNLTPVG